MYEILLSRSDFRVDDVFASLIRELPTPRRGREPEGAGSFGACHLRAAHGRFRTGAAPIGAES